MNIYDFDGTIYNGDSCQDLIIYRLKKHTILTIKSLVKTIKLRTKYKKGLIPFEVVKESLLSFIFKIDNYELFIDNFVNTHIKKIKPWYLSQKKNNDVIISASCDLWIDKFCHKLGLKNIISTNIDKDGKLISKNCKGKEKVRRFREIFKDAIPEGSYSDSEVDKPILEIAKKAYVVEGNKVITYIKGYNFKNKK
jgi:phosphoserine phosphatase